MTQLELTTLIAYLAFTVFFLVAYKLDQISLLGLILTLIASAVLAVLFYVLMAKYWPLF
ncbi:hypothetical protein [Brevibacillus choshinensis]|uniref:hypothetical protein n=1 Tax=Brevibacillus choshinensis TaxID=54911 RepID=UPI002E1DF318|nr:hypothetical protein [Brevibacillus choshinensis]MED4751833.1 hypothetical protein [Brevibacillus choshinensis]MED4784425.1 hypothetical protein [Brevibacillus choshinensis]